MALMIYDINPINSLTINIYCGTDDVIDFGNFGKFHNIPIKTDDQLIFSMKFNTKINLWQYHHANITISKKLNESTFLKLLSGVFLEILDKTKIYYGQVIDESLEAINNNNSEILVHCFFQSKEKTYKRFVIAKKIYYEYKISPQNNYSNMFMTINPKINSPGSGIDLIFYLISSTTSKQDIRKLTDKLLCTDFYENTKPSMYDLKNRFDFVHKLEPKKEYCEIYELFNKNDKEYFDSKLKQFQKSVINLFYRLETSFGSNNTHHIGTGNGDYSLAQRYYVSCFVSEFSNDLKKNLASELDAFYHRLRLFPNERKELYKYYGNHPYVKLIKTVHTNFQKNYTKGDRITPERIYDMMGVTISSTILVEALTSRSELFVPVYNLFLKSKENNIQPKFKTNYNYFPFKIFSTNLFVMENMLNNNKYCVN